MTKNKVPGAQPLFESLMTFFRKRRRPGESELWQRAVVKESAEIDINE
jgi:hypothetical protein